jgi:hypothetical protein
MRAALSIRQPWAWLIVNGFKDIENRDWPTKFRGRVLVHAGKALTVADYEAAMLFVELFHGPQLVHQVPDMAELTRGALVGSVDVVDCVQYSPSLWFTGSGEADGAYGFVLANAKVMQPIPWKGQLGFFNVPREVLP